MSVESIPHLLEAVSKRAKVSLFLKPIVKHGVGFFPTSNTQVAWRLSGMFACPALREKVSDKNYWL